MNGFGLFCFCILATKRLNSTPCCQTQSIYTVFYNVCLIVFILSAYGRQHQHWKLFSDLPISQSKYTTHFFLLNWQQLGKEFMWNGSCIVGVVEIRMKILE